MIDPIRFYLGALTLVFFCFSSCYYDIEEELYGVRECQIETPVTYSVVVAPLMESHCTSCHGGSTPQASISLETYAEVRGYVDNGKLLCTIEHGSGCEPMPDNAPQIPVCDIELIRSWINAGANDD